MFYTFPLTVHLVGWGVDPVTCVPGPPFSSMATVPAITLDLLKCILLCKEELIFISDRMDLAWIALCVTFYKKGASICISSVTVAFLSFNNASLFPWKFQVPWTGDFCIITFLPNSILCFTSPAHKGLVSYCQLWGKPHSSTVAHQEGSCPLWPDLLWSLLKCCSSNSWLFLKWAVPREQKKTQKTKQNKNNQSNKQTLKDKFKKKKKIIIMLLNLYLSDYESVLAYFLQWELNVVLL